MRAAIFVENDRPLVVEDVTPTEPGPRDVVVRITASGICHSDLSVINGTLPMPPPAILGHEGTGIVDWVGPEVRGLAVGDRVIGSFIPACGHCWFCLHDQSNLCENTYTVMMSPRATRGDGTPLPTMTGLGTFADMMTADEMSLVKIETDLPDEQLALIGCGVTTGVGRGAEHRQGGARLDGRGHRLRRCRPGGDPGRAHRRRGAHHRDRPGRAEARHPR